MADITVTSTNKTFFRIDDAVAALLLEAFPESFKRYEKPAAPPASDLVQFGIELTGAYYTLVRTKGGECTYLSAPWDQVKKQWPDCPEEIGARWKSLGEGAHAPYSWFHPSANHPKALERSF